jgi:signal transduction histidine kinase
VRAIAFFLCVLSFTAAVVTSVGMLKPMADGHYTADLRNMFIDKDYIHSYEMQSDLDSKLSMLLYEFESYRSENYIRDGHLIDGAARHEFEMAVYELAERGVWRNRNVTIRLDPQALESVPMTDDYKVDIVSFMRENEDSVAMLREAIIASQLEDFRQSVNGLRQIEGFDFYISDGENTVMRGPRSADLGAFTDKPAYLVYSGSRLSKYPATPVRYSFFDNWLKSRLDAIGAPSTFTMRISFDEAYISSRAAAYDAMKSRLSAFAPVVLGCLLLSLLLLVFLIISTGRRDEYGRIVLSAPDRIFTEIQLCVVLAAIGSEISILSLPHAFLNLDWIYWEPLDIGLFGLPIAVIAAIALWCMLSMARKVKAGTFFRNTILWSLASWLYRIVRMIFDRQNPMGKVLLVALALVLLSSTILLAPVMLVLVLVFGPRWAGKYTAIKAGVEEVRNGNLSWRIPVPDGAHGELDELARGINDISSASDIAVQNELKNQRLKTELISNVSHDLKTPLTSIITYIDLLKREGLDSPDAPEYLGVLEEKAQRLRKLTDDLFDAAKASSGAIPVRFERVDLLSLVRQGLGEMDAGFAAARLQVVLNARNEKYYVEADGQLLWRIVENLMCNVQKYALPDSRVYIDIFEREARGRGLLTMLEVKNISRAQLNMPADELMERFKRGDLSRSTEGSGLGLAIAKDLAILQNGWFEIMIDGDLFKSQLMLNPWRGRPGGPDDAGRPGGPDAGPGVPA